MVNGAEVISLPRNSKLLNMCSVQDTPNFINEIFSDFIKNIKDAFWARNQNLKRNFFFRRKIKSEKMPLCTKIGCLL